MARIGSGWEPDPPVPAADYRGRQAQARYSKELDPATDAGARQVVASVATLGSRTHGVVMQAFLPRADGASEGGLSGNYDPGRIGRTIRSVSTPRIWAAASPRRFTRSFSRML